MERPLSFTMMGVKVKFPFPPYESQISMVMRVIKACKRLVNVAIECPTGCGKTMGILSGLLAWQEYEQLQVEKFQKQMEASKDTEVELIEESPTPRNNVPAVSSFQVQPVPCESSDPSQKCFSEVSIIRPKKKSKVVPEVIILDSDDEADFKDIKMPGYQYTNKLMDCCDQVQEKGPSSPKERNGQWFEKQNEDVIPELEYSKQSQSEADLTSFKVAKIYYGTRTHRQIKQVVRELRKSFYSGVRMTVLSSREHTCIRSLGKFYSSKTEMCSDLLGDEKHPNCGFYHNSSQIASHKALEKRGFSTPWDIEDLVSLGRSCSACPYFAARDLMDTAQLVICPYNYLVDPVIRSSMNIDLTGAIVVIDEAHNLEKTCMDGASIIIFYDSLAIAEDELKKLFDPNHTTYYPMSLFLNKLRQWIEKNKEIGMHFTGTDLVANLTNFGLTQDYLKKFKSHLNSVGAENEQHGNKMSSATQPLLEEKMSSATKSLCEELGVVLSYLYASHVNFYAYFDNTIKPKGLDDVAGTSTANWKDRRKPVLTLHILCMNPAIIFSEIESKARCVILASGTLSPLGALAKELGTKFGDTLVSGHVISPEQLWVGVLSRGPLGHTLNGRFECCRTFEYMDDLGTLVLEVCQQVPHGVLCFLPSYGFMRNILERWRSTDLLSQMKTYKEVVVESQVQEEFDEGMSLFFATIHRTSNELQPLEQCTGALLFAVMRGKVSEGVDFADNDARAIISVGIPYPQIKDKAVLLKKEFNNLNTSKGFVTGNEWYQVQAFRAMNQALGRGLRHKGDWCALLVVDERFMNGKNLLARLPQWISSQATHYSRCEQMLSSLSTFATRRASLQPDPRFSNERLNRVQSSMDLDV